MDRGNDPHAEAFAALGRTADALLERDGVRAVALVDDRGEPVLARGDAAADLVAEAPRLLRAAGGAESPVLVRDGRRTVLVRGVVTGLWLLAGLDDGVRSGLCDRLTRPSTEILRRILAPLLARGAGRTP